MILQPQFLDTDGRIALQRELQAKGFYKDEIDGKWGPESAAAFAAWQASLNPKILILTETDLTADVRAELERLFEAARIPTGDETEVMAAARKLLAGRTRYEAVSSTTGVPWYVIGCIHQRECDGRFDQHLHNGDLLTARTVHEPKGRPITGHAPFDWSYSAADALVCDGLTRWTDWSVAGVLHKLEAFNGYGYRVKALPTPYLWNMTTVGRPGKYVRDGVFDPAAVDAQPGCASLLLALERMNAVQF